MREEVLQRIKRLSLAKSEKNSYELAEHIIKGLLKNDIRNLAIRYVVSLIESYQRHNIHKTEKSVTIISQEEAKPSESKKTVIDNYALGRPEYILYKEDPINEHLRSRERSRAKSYKGFDEWFEECRKIVERNSTKKEYERFYYMWFPEESPEIIEIHRKHNMQLNNMIKDWKNKIRLEVTKELLESHFALGDGTKTTWGEANIKQHIQRIDMLTKHSAGTLETATRHQIAIDMIEKESVTCLNELKKKTQKKRKAA